ncbi:hypothetical protein ACXM1Q_008205 [Streptococcus sp. 10F2]
MKNLDLKRLWIYYFILMGLAIFLFPILPIMWLILVMPFWEEETEIAEPLSVIEIYNRVGLEGEVRYLDDLAFYTRGKRAQYTYKENGKTYTFDIPIDNYQTRPVYTYAEVVDLYTEQNDTKLEDYDRFLFKEFFDQALYNNKVMRDYQDARVKSLKDKGLLNVQLELEYPYYYLDEKNKKIFNKEMKKDLEIAHKNGYVPVYGIDTLDPLKYWSLSSSYMIFSIDSSINQFLEVIKQIDPQEWQPGYYRVEERQGLVYANFHVNEKGIWTNITDEESNSAE